LPHGAAVRGLVFDRSGEALVTSSDNTAWIWNTSDGSLKREAPLPEQAHLHLEAGMGLDSLVVVAHLPDGAFRLLNLANSQWVSERLKAQEVNQIQFSPDRTRLATVGSDQCGRIWDACTGQPLTPPFKHGGNLFSVEWSPDGRRVVTGGLSGEAKVWDAATGEPILPPMGLRGSTRVAHFSPDGRFLAALSSDHTARVWDAATAEAVTPVLHHSGEVRAVMVTTNNRIVTVSDPAVIRAWDLMPTRLPATVVADYARLLAGRKLDRNGVLQKLPASELGGLGYALRSTHPELFTAPKERAGEWHRRQVQEPDNLTLVRAGEFHLNRLAELDPGNPELKQQQVRFHASLVPPRDPATPANLLDLSGAYTHTLKMPSVREFETLNPGVQVLAGTPFDVRGLLFLEASDPGEAPVWGLLSAVRGLAVGRRCRQIHFRQATERENGGEGEEVARWVLHYADGSVRDWPVLYGEQVRDWCWLKKDPKEARQAVIAWEGRPGKLRADLGVECVRLYKATWTNPQPDIEVSSIDFVLSKTRLRPFVVAITAE
jgi:hypothetical protein